MSSASPGPRFRRLPALLGFLIGGLGSAAPAAAVDIPGICVNPAGTSGCVRTIQAAIDRASEGTTITVAAGTYSESVSLNKSVLLVGQGADVTTIDAAGADNAVHVTAPSARIQGFTVTGARLDGVLVNADRVQVVGNTLAGNATLVIPPPPGQDIPTVFNNINLQNASDGYIADNTIANSNGRGVRTEGSAAYNAPDFGVQKLVIGRSDRNVITNNLIHDNMGGCGIVLSTDSSQNIVSGNTVINNTTGLIISGLPPFGLPNTPFADHIPHSDGNIIVNNILSGNPTPGIGVHPIIGTAIGNIIAGNTVTDNGPCEACDGMPVGIYVFSGPPGSTSVDNIIGPDNVVSGSDWGIFVGGTAVGTQVFRNQVSVPEGGVPLRLIAPQP